MSVLTTRMMSRQAVSESKDGCLVRVIVRPSSGKRELIEEFTDEYVRINLKSPARGGRANLELLKRLAKCFGVSSADLVITMGKRSREKIILVRNASVESIRPKLETA